MLSKSDIWKMLIFDNTLIMSLREENGIDFNQFCSIVSGEKSACLFGYFPHFLSHETKIETMAIGNFFLVLVGWIMLHCTNVKKTSRVPKPLVTLGCIHFIRIT